MDPSVMEWVGIILRWGHVIVSMVWVGTSFYLLTWENKFNRSTGLREDVAGNFWTIQGGDFYYVEKIKNAPERVPEPLHWFKYEAYFTWLSGFLLMCVFYYAQAPLMLVAPGYPVQSAWQAVALSCGSLAAAFMVYSLYSTTRMARNLSLSAVAGLIYVALLATFYLHLLPVRAAVLHVGVALGTVMSANVYFFIIPWHKKLVHAIEHKQPTGDIYLAHPGFRSRHNHYLTLPVLFLMLGSHAPGIFDGRLGWLVASLAVLAAGLFKHWHTCIQRKHSAARYLLAGLTVFGLAAVVSGVGPAMTIHCGTEVSRESVLQIVRDRCLSCHQTSVVGPAGPVVISLGSTSDLLSHDQQIMERVVNEKTMPPANASGMLDHERHLIGCWLTQNSPGG